jgi:3-hydroxyacyl-CoA dehydrogenase
MLVVGAGTMGHGLAQVFASGGYDVQLVDVSASILGRALRQIRSNLEMMAEAEALDRTEIVRIRNPERFCIAHWYAPPYIIPLVDVVKGPETSDDTADRVARLLTRLGKKPVVLDRFIQGYLVNRLQVAIGREVNDLLDRGLATPEQLDEAVKASLAPRMVVVGVAQRYDFTGLDVSLAIQKEMAKRLSAMPAYSTMQRLVDAGHMGVKTGKGFYDYDGKTPRQILKARDLALLKIFKQTAGGGLDRT